MHQRVSGFIPSPSWSERGRRPVYVSLTLMFLSPPQSLPFTVSKKQWKKCPHVKINKKVKIKCIAFLYPALNFLLNWGVGGYTLPLWAWRPFPTHKAPWLLHRVRQVEVKYVPIAHVKLVSSSQLQLERENCASNSHLINCECLLCARHQC